jgi:large subunit ribosomal protein L30
MAANDSKKTVKVTLVRSVIGTRESHRATVRGLGLRKIRQTVELEDTPAVRGMIHKIDYLVKAEG